MSPLTLKDGRTLGYEEDGDAKGKPLLYFHGSPGSRVEAQPMDAPPGSTGCE